jgi:transcriptional regulator with PAS, ATPase and Fis domain
MKKKPLSHYLDLMKSAQDKREWTKEAKYGEIALKKLSRLSYSHLEEYLLYTRLGYACMNLAEYSRSLDTFYKAYSIASKNHLAPASIAHISFAMGDIFLSMKNIKQALSQFQKVVEYYQKYGDSTLPMDKKIQVYTLIGLGYCYLYQNELEKVREIIEQNLSSYQLLLLNKAVLINYYHLKGEYLVALKEYDQARQSFQECIKLSEQLNLPFMVLNTKIHLAKIDFLEGNLNEAIQTLQTIMKNDRQLELNKSFCEARLLLSKCHLLKNMPDKATAIENGIKPLLNKLDIVWLYEKSREFEQLYRQLQPIYQIETKFTPQILTQTLNQCYESFPYKIIIGQSTPMIEVYQLVEKIAPTDLPVLIQGETGTGKELVARAIHNSSLRDGRMWLATNCGAVPETLLENELFGHNKGAFTDAKKDKKGYIELASEGTLFLDEISEMSPNMQHKLLRVLEEQQVWRLGAEKPIPVNTRFIFASNQNIEELVKKASAGSAQGKRFREDLFYRINTIVITLPPLRDRKDDIPLLINYFLSKYSLSNRPSSLVPIVSPEALSSLQAYHWPGNVRELENEIKRICTLYPNAKSITKIMLSEPIRNYNSLVVPALITSSFKEARKLAEKNLIINSIKKTKGNITQSARLLGCDRRYLYRKINQLKINTNTIFVTKS